MSSASPTRRTPFTVIGGFLGAGKTTFVNHLLRHARQRYAVLVNDFGAINIDADLIAEHDGETLRLSNGCVCCSLAGDFAGTIAGLLAAVEKFDHVFIEASGVADPWAIAEIALVEPDLFLNTVVAVVDAERLLEQVGDARLGDTAVRQIAAADLVLLNKTDLVDGAGKAACVAAIKNIQPTARVIETVGAALSPDFFDDGKITQATGRFRGEAVDHEQRFSRVLYRRSAVFDAARIAATLDRMPPVLLRLKGFCAFDREVGSRLLQWTAGRWCLVAFDRTAGDWPIELVGIGTADLDEDALCAMLDAALLRV